MTDDENRWSEIVHELQDTCKSPHDLGEDVEQLFDENQEFCLYVDQHIFQCSECGWWCEISEEASEDAGLPDWTCQQCVDGH